MRTPKLVVGAVVFGWALLAWGLFNVAVPLPPEWLKAWTTLIASVIGVALALRVLWEAPELLHDLIKKRS